MNLQESVFKSLKHCTIRVLKRYNLYLKLKSLSLAAMIGMGGLFLMKKVHGALRGVSCGSSLIDGGANEDEPTTAHPEPSSSSSLFEPGQKQSYHYYCSKAFNVFYLRI